MNFLLNPTRHISPEPMSQVAPGMGLMALALRVKVMPSLITDVRTKNSLGYIPFGSSLFVKTHRPTLNAMGKHRLATSTSSNFLLRHSAKFGRMITEYVKFFECPRLIYDVAHKQPWLRSFGGPGCL